jgi:hypothetical protein
MWREGETPEFLKDTSVFIIFDRQRMELKSKTEIAI